MEKTKLEMRKMILVLAEERLNQLMRENEFEIKKTEVTGGIKHSNLEHEKRMLSNWKATSEEVGIWKNEVTRLL